VFLLLVQSGRLLHCIFYAQHQLKYGILLNNSGFESQKAFQPKLLIVLFYVLFMCKCVLYYCHRVSTQLQLTYISISVSISISRLQILNLFLKWYFNYWIYTLIIWLFSMAKLFWHVCNCNCILLTCPRRWPHKMAKHFVGYSVITLHQNAIVHLLYWHCIHWINAQNLVKTKQFLHKPEQALRVPGGSGSQISRQSAHGGGKVVCPTHWPPLPSVIFPGVNSWVNSRAIERPEGLCQLKLPTTPSWIEPRLSGL
jgi:hypothetical protein